jgi:hypothetical protein
MDGLNQEYRTSPTHFLRNTALAMNPSIGAVNGDPRELVTGLQHFDIRPLPYPGAAELKFFIDAGQAQHFGDRQVGMGGDFNAMTAQRAPQLQAVGVIWRPAPNVRPVAREKPILAYWLPYEADKTYEVTLGPLANYFFTAGLSGCCVKVTGDPVAPRVAHINRTETGNAVFDRVVGQPMVESDDPLDKQRAKARGTPFASRTNKDVQTDRQLLFQELKTAVDAKASGRAIGGDLNGYCKWGEHYTTLCGVVGIRNQGTGVWSFYYQKLRNEPAPTGGEYAKLGFLMRRDGELMRMA